MALKSADIPAVKPGGSEPANLRANAPASPPVKLPAKPEDQELTRKRLEHASIEGELAERELRAANLRAELSAFERQYLHFVGLRYAELDDLKAQVAERAAAARPEDAQAQEAAREARQRASETKSTAGEKARTEPRAFEAPPEMKRLFREVAKKIHPDLTSDRTDRLKRQELMAEANEAYEQGDESKLTKILAEYESSPEAVQGDGAGAELVRVIRRISQARGRLAEIEAETQELLRSDLHQLKSRTDEARRHGRDVLAEMTAKVEEQIETARRRLGPESEPKAPQS